MTTTTATPPDDGAAPVPADAGSSPPGSGGRRFWWASATGGVLSVCVLTWLATRGAATLFDTPRFGNFYDAQARALFHGRWEMPAEVLSFERFNIDGRFYTYFGPTPALLRMPLLLFTSALDGRLSRVATIAACVVMVGAIIRLSWLARRSVRGDHSLSRAESVVAAGVVLVASLGTVAPYLAGWTAVYHEAIIWGVAFALVSYGALIAWTIDARARDLVVASAAAALSVLARGSVGFGPIAALGLVAAMRGWAALRARNSGRALDWRLLGGLAAAVAIPIVCYGYVNQVKFGAAFAAPPFGKQDILVSDLSPRRAAMAANGGSLLGPRYTSTVVYHYFRPDGVAFDRLFPFAYARAPTRVFGGNVFEALWPTTSVPAASPLALIVATVGAVVAIVRKGLRAAWLAPVVGSVVGAGGAVTLAFVDERYQGDFIPALVVPGVLGAWWAVDWLSRRSRAVVLTAAVVAVVLGTWSLFVNFATAFVYQRSQNPFATVDDRASLVKAGLQLQDVIGGLPARVTAGAALPENDAGGSGDLFVLGDCQGVYRHNGYRWQVVEQTPRTGAHHVRLHLDDDATGRQPVLSSVDDLGTTVISARNGIDDRVELDYWYSPAAGETQRIRLGSVARDDKGFVDVTASIDYRDGVTAYLQLRANGRLLYDDVINELHGPLEVGAFTADGSRVAVDGIERRPVATPICDRLVDMGLDVADRVDR